MSKTRTLKDVFKNSSDVISLETTDRIGVIGSEGESKKVDLNTIKDTKTSSYFPVSNGQWLRFARYLYSQSPTGILFLTHVYNSSSPQSISLVFNSQSSSSKVPISVAILCGTPTPSFNAIRCVAEGNYRYLEVKFAKTSTNSPIIRFVGLSLELVPFSISTAADADVINTVSLISAGGGKTLSISILCNYTERRMVA